jgi:hypothetical protein
MARLNPSRFRRPVSWVPCGWSRLNGGWLDSKGIEPLYLQPDNSFPPFKWPDDSMAQRLDLLVTCCLLLRLHVRDPHPHRAGFAVGPGVVGDESQFDLTSGTLRLRSDRSI